jgi:hypothetical protein
MNEKIPYQEPELNGSSFNCPWCNSYSHMNWDWLKTTTHHNSISNLKISFCSHCDMYSLWYNGQMIFPAKISVELPNSDLPEEIIADYNEAANIVSISPRGATALLRLAIQKLCKHLGGKGENINDDIANLVKNGLPSRIQKALDTVRVVGNEAVHPGVFDLNDNKEIAFALFKLVNIIAEKMISEDKEIDKLYEILPEEKREQIKKRDQ